MSAFRITCLVLIFLLSADRAGAEPLELSDGDRVVFLGNTLTERAQSNDYVETMLTAAWPDRNITFRNLGWSGDTVWGEARARFGTAEDGFKHLVDHVTALRPTVVIVSYGTNESFAGEAGLAKFHEGYVRLLDALSSTGARFVLVTPLRMETMPAPLPDATATNENLSLYIDAVRKLAAERKLGLIDLSDLYFSYLMTRRGGELTDDGMHLNDRGYWYLASYLARHALHKQVAGFEPDRKLTEGLHDKSLFADDAKLEELRQTILKKNELYFYRWRPQNETYLFGFRKYEQGNNAVEIPQFDPLVEEQERQIRALVTEIHHGGEGK